MLDIMKTKISLRKIKWKENKKNITKKIITGRIVENAEIPNRVYSMIIEALNLIDYSFFIYTFIYFS